MLKSKKTSKAAREARQAALKALPERLQRLNREMAIDRILDFDNSIYVTRGEYRIRLSVFRNGGNGFCATAKIAGHVHRYNGELPSDAVQKLIDDIKRNVAQMEYAKNLAKARMYETEAA